MAGIPAKMITYDNMGTKKVLPEVASRIKLLKREIDTLELAFNESWTVVKETRYLSALREEEEEEFINYELRYLNHIEFSSTRRLWEKGVKLDLRDPKQKKKKRPS